MKNSPIRQWLSKPYPYSGACGCLGFANDTDPVCHCAMRWVETIDGRFYKIEEIRSTDGVTHTAKEIFRPEILKEEEALSLKEREGTSTKEVETNP